jgi:hypothetical protein
LFKGIEMPKLPGDKDKDKDKDEGDAPGSDDGKKPDSNGGTTSEPDGGAKPPEKPDPKPAEAGARPSDKVDAGGQRSNSPGTSRIVDAVSGIAEVAAVPVVTFEFKAIRQVEKGTFSLDLNTRQAMRKTFMPQHLLGFLTEGISKDDPKHYLKVRMDDPFYQKLRLLLDPPDAEVYSRWGLKSVKADVLYNKKQINSEASKSSFDQGHRDRTELVTAWRPEVGRAYEYVVTYNFGSRASTDWESNDGRTSYTFTYSEPKAVDAPFNTNIDLSPASELRFISVSIEPSKRMDEKMLGSVEVEMRYQDYVPGVDKDHPKSLKGDAPSVINRTYVVEAKSKAQMFRVRTGRKQDRENCSYRLKYNFNQEEQLVDGAQTPWLELAASRLEIETPSIFEINFDLWDLDPEDIKLVTFKLIYQDASGYRWEKTVKKKPADLEEDQDVSFRIPLMDVRAKKEVGYAVTVVWQAKGKSRLQKEGIALAGTEIKIS